MWSFKPLLSGSSNLSNALSASPRSREEKETRALYEAARVAHGRLPFSSEDATIDFIIDVVFEATRQAEIAPSRRITLALCAFVEELLAAEGIAKLPSPEAISNLTIEEGIELRASLSRMRKISESWTRSERQWRNMVCAVLVAIFDALPYSVLESDQETGGSLTQGTRFSVPLIDLCDEPAATIERAMRPFFHVENGECDLFHQVRGFLEVNAYDASGMVSEQDMSKDVILPTKFKASSNREVVQTYCNGTPLHGLFETALPFDIPFPARFEHTHIVGGSGHGKTQLMQLLIHGDLQKAAGDGRSVIVIDSQGDLIRTISSLEIFGSGSNSGLSDRLVVIDPTDIEFPVCLNLFDWNRDRFKGYSALEREKLLNSAIELYEYLFGALLGAELTQRQDVIFRYIARLMIEIPGATIHTLRELMENGEKFRPYMERLPGSARSFFETRFFDRTFNETKKQILTRLWGVLSNATLERMFSHPKNKIDFFEATNSGKIILINTAKDLLKQDGTAILGRFFIALIAQAALERSALPPTQRNPTFLYIDEAQDYFDENIGHLLNQARKYRVGMIFAHQNLDQLSANLRSSVMASTSIKFAGGVSAKDARVLSDEMRCDDAVLMSTRKRRNHTEFACHVRNLTAQAIHISVPLGVVEALPTLSAQDARALTIANRNRVAEVRQASLSETSAPALAPLSIPTSSTSNVSEQPHAIVPSIPTANLPEIARADPPVPQKPRARTETSTTQGRGGRQHRYLQQLLCLAAQERGFKAVIEEPVLDGAGKVDVSLCRNDRKIACEISVTTGKDHELGNIEKCLAAGYQEVLLVTTDERQVKALSQFISGNLEEGVRDKVRYLTPEAAIALFDEIVTGSPPAVQTVRGYKVKVRQSALDPSEVRARRQTVASILARSIKSAKDIG